MTKFLSLIKNRYFASSLFFVVWIMFFDANDMMSRLKVEQEINKLNYDLNYYNEQIIVLKETQENLANNPKELEKFAREKYFMKRAGEDVYVIINE